MTHSRDTDSPAQISVILVAAGESTRMGGIDKLTLEIDGRPVIRHSLETFESCELVDRIVVVSHESKLGWIKQCIAEARLATQCKVVSGGARRQDSVNCGLQALAEWNDPNPFVAVHDAARPFVDGSMLQSGLAAARYIGAAIPVTPLKDTVKQVENRIVVDTPDRSSLFAVQTPQIFRADVLRAAHQTVSADVTDDAAMVEQAGGLVATFEGAYTNIKITTPSDIPVANALIDASIAKNLSSPRFRYGIGFDGHALVDGGPLRIGGTDIPFEMRLQGHSDGDVLFHAVASAILGAAGLGDLGGMFPSSDARYAGVESKIFVSEAAAKAVDLGWQIDHLDATVIAQRPRLAAHVPNFCFNIATAADIEPTRVNVKITSTDEVGAIGNGDGIAAQAIATLRSHARHD